GRPGAAHLALPFDVQKAPVEDAELHGDPALGRYPAWPAGPDPEAVARAAALLLEARDPVFVCGGGPIIAGGEAELQALAERLAAPVCTTISGKGVLPDDHPLSVGVIGSNGGVPETRAVIDAADVVVFTGCRAGSVTTERWRHPAPGQARIIHIDCDPAVIGANYATEVALAGDARLALSALNAALAGETPDTGRRTITAAAIAGRKAAKFEAFQRLAESDERPIRPERLVATLQDLLDEDAVLVADPGTPCPYFSAYYRLARPGRHYFSNRAHGALGYSLSAAVGASFGRPGVKVVSVMGDGSFGFTGGELETVVRLGLPITFVVVSNAVFGWIKAGQKTGFGERYFSVDFSRTDHAAVATAYGVKGWRVEDPGELKPTLAAALDHGGPSLVDVICQPLQEARAPVSEWVS
ncbi:MAG TPA: thiamine pyrophosphate-binding protein, partial [Alphaproteobacteria bacterium]|nr:thiamine pyrophosphate-binding protein [Alphaproteobacteria bacterium]